MDNIFGVNFNLMKIDYFRKFFYIVPKIPRQVNIEATNKCNLSCKMCKRKELNIAEEDIPLEHFKEIINKLPLGVQEISFGSYGESFIHPHIFELIKYVKDKKFAVTITTNGFAFIDDKNREKLLASKIDILRVSVEEINSHLYPYQTQAHPFSEKMLNSLEQLAQERNNANSNVKLFFNTVVHTGNYNKIINIINYAEKIGFDQIELIHLDQKWNQIYEYLPKEKEIALYKKIKTMPFKIKVTSLYDRYIGIRKYAFHNMKYCPFTYDVCHITISGDVTPCCFGLPRYKIDNIFEKDLSEIWNGEQFQRFRKEQREICNGCTLMHF